MERNNKRMASPPETLLHTKSPKKPKLEVPLRLIDLNVDCLMKIFCKFSIIDLVNVVEADNHLITAARSVFRRNYSKSSVEVTNKFDPKTDNTSVSVKLVKHFGDMIGILKVVYQKKYSRFNDLLDDAILEKCQNNLSEIEIENADQLVFHKIVKPFAELRKVCFVSSDAPDVILHFERWFPKADTLELRKLKVDKKIEKANKKKSPLCEDSSDSCSDSDSENGYGFYGKPLAALAKHYPTVEHFAISNVPEVYKCDNRVRNQDIEKFVELNPQLKSLFIETDDIDHYNEEMWVEAGHSSWSHDGIEIETGLADFIQHLVNLENFHLIWKTGQSSEGCELHFKHLQELTVECEIRRGHFYVGTDNVDCLNIFGKRSRKIDRCCVDLLQWNKTATFVNICGIWCDTKIVTSAFNNIDKMPKLKELQLSYKSIYGQKIIQKLHIDHLLDRNKTLKKLTLDFDGDIQLLKETSEEFDAGIDLHWEIVSRKNSQLVFVRITEA